MNDTLPLSIQPVISYPKEAEVGKTYLMEIDLQMPESGFEWQYEEEEYLIYCMVNAGNLFTVRTVGEPAIVLHRFGGTYGNAKFLLEADIEEKSGSISVVFVNQWGTPIKSVNCGVTLQESILSPTLPIENSIELIKRVVERGLENLNMSSQNLEAFPDEIFDLSSLEELNLSQNNIQVIPEEIGHLSNLRILNLSYNLLTEIYSSFDPFQPPSPEAYVEFESVRGGWEIVREMGYKIKRSKQPTCQLYSGHRGVGKSTELLRLLKYLEQENYFVVYFAADDEDIEPQDTEYADILFACTRHLVQEIKLEKTHNPLLNWMQEHWESMKDLAMTKISFQELSLEAQIAQFGKISANLRATPDKRQEIRQEINANTTSLVEALNDFIREGEKYLKSVDTESRGIVLMVDNLDRIVETKEEGKPSNHNEIYLNRSELLRGLACHVIYTVPIAMIYSGQASQLENNYDTPDVMPMIIVRNPNDEENSAGLEKLRELISRRVELIDPNLVKTLTGKVEGLDYPPVFDSPETLNFLCLMSGGHVRNLVQLIQKAIDWTDVLPITAKAARRAMEETRETYRKTVQEGQWEILARSCHLRQAKNDEQHLRLLLNRCLLEYRYYDDEDTLQIWHNVHPLIEGIPRFQEELKKYESGQAT